MSVQHYEPQTSSAVAHVPDRAGSVQTAQVTDLVAYAEQAKAAYAYAEMVVSTEFCPQVYRRKPYEAAAAILAGGELGFSPMASLRCFDNINGVASPKAITQRAVVQSHGHELYIAESSATRVVARGRRKGAEEWQESVWTIERAELAGFVKKNPNYKTLPESMLIARASAECARMIASDALLGIPYAAEELQDDAALTAPHPDSMRALPRQARRGSTTVSAADLTGDAPVDAAPATTVDVQTITRDQGKRIGELFHEAEVDDRAVRARIVNQLTDRPISGLGDLTLDEAQSLISTLDEMGPADINALAGATYGNDEQPDGDES